MSAVEFVMTVTPIALPAETIARRAGVEIEQAYAELVSMEGRRVAEVVPCRGEWLWRLVPMVARQ